MPAYRQVCSSSKLRLVRSQLYHPRAATILSSCRRSLSSTTTDEGGSSDDGDKKNTMTTTKTPKTKTKDPSRSGPVKITQTPRSVAAEKLRPTEGAPPLNGSSSSSSSISNNSQQNEQQQQMELPPLVNAGASNDRNAPFVYGGTPCDPSPPPFQLSAYGEESLYTLVLLRHGESEWNAQNRYTGWCDVALTPKGEMEARTAGRLLHENGIELDHAYTSVLKRASFSCNMALNTAKQHWVPVTKTWRLSERHYGALQGYNKDTAWKELNMDQELVMQMRRSYDVPPPRMEDDHPFWHGNDRRYAKLSPDQLERSRAESLKDTADRIMPFFNSVISPSLRAGNKCIIVSHANTIRTLIKQIDGISDEDIKGMTIPTGIPLLYRLDKNLKPVDPHLELDFRYMVEPKGFTWGTSRAHGFHGVYLGDLERLQDIQKKRDLTNRDWQRIILKNIGKSLGWDFDTTKDTRNTALSDPKVVSTRQLWWQVHSKMQSPDYRNMLLLNKMSDILEDLMYNRRQKFVTKDKYEKLVDKLHLDTEGSVIEPFVELADRRDRDERQRLWYENLALDLEEECLIK